MDAPDSPAPGRTITLAFVGSPAVGKTRMVLQAARKKLEDADTQMMFFSYDKLLEVDGNTAKIVLCDTQDGQDHLDQRTRACKVADVIFLCYSTIQPQSLQAVEQHWGPVLRSFAKPVILVGTKTDMRANEQLCERLRDKGMNPVTREQGQQASEAIGALAFYEISCEEEGDPLDKVFREVLELVFGTPKPKPNGRRGRSGKNENCIIS